MRCRKCVTAFLGFRGRPHDLYGDAVNLVIRLQVKPRGKTRTNNADSDLGTHGSKCSSIRDESGGYFMVSAPNAQGIKTGREIGTLLRKSSLGSPVARQPARPVALPGSRLNGPSGYTSFA